MENNEKLSIVFGIICTLIVLLYLSTVGLLIVTGQNSKNIDKLTIQIDSLKKQDSIKELYRVYNAPTGADTLLKPISK